jgi:hypothetical protein
LRDYEFPLIEDRLFTLFHTTFYNSSVHVQTYQKS